MLPQRPLGVLPGFLLALGFGSDASLYSFVVRARLAWVCDWRTYSSYHVSVRLRIKQGAGLSVVWTRDENIPQGCP